MSQERISTTSSQITRRLLLSRRAFLRAVGAVGTAAVLSACQTSAPTATVGAPTPTQPATTTAPTAAPATTSSASGETIKIGAALELTGGDAAFGEGTRRGAQMALEKINSTMPVLGKRLELVVEDTQSNAQATINAINSLLGRQQIRFLIGPIGSTGASTAGSAVAQYKPIWVVPGASSSAMETRWGKEPWFFHPFPWDRDYYRASVGLLEPIKSQVPRVGIVYVNNVYGTAHIEFARQAYQNAGFEIVIAEPFEPGSRDYSSLLARVNQANPDVFHAIVQPGDAIALAKATVQAGLKAKLFNGNSVPGLTDWLDAVGPTVAEGWLGIVAYAPGVRWPASDQYPNLFPSSEQWEKDFQAKYNRLPIANDACGYSALVQLALALNKAGTTDQDKVIDALHNLKTMTIMGPLEYKTSPGGAVHSAYSDMLVIQIQGGKRVVVHPQSAANGKLQFRQG